MKRFTSLMLMLLVAVTTFAAKNDAVTLADGWYAFKANNTSRYVQFNGERVIKATVENPSITSGIVFYVTKGDGNKYTIQTPDGKFLTYKNATSNGDQIAVVAAADANDSNKWWTIREGKSENLRTIVPSTNVGDGVPGWNFAVYFNGANGALGFWGCNDDGSQWIISKAPFVTVGEAKIKCAGTVMSYDGENIVKADDENSIFTISKNETGDRFAIQEVGGKFLVNQDGGIAVVDAESATDENKWWTITMNIGPGSEGAVDILPSIDAPANNSSAFNWAKTIEGKGVNSGLGYWDANDNNSYCTIEWVETVECVYNLVYAGETKGTETHQVVLGDFFPAATTELPFGVAASKLYSPITAADVNEGKIVKNVALVNTLPFEPANSVENIANWYYMNVRDDGPTYAYYDSSISYIKADKSSVDAGNKDAYSWAFVGNPWDGFSIVNKAAGTTMVLSSPVVPNTEKNAEQLPRMVTATEATGNTTWVIAKPTHAVIAKNGFYIQHPTATSYAINRQGYNSANTLCYWTGRDTGSTFQVVLRNDEEEQKALVAEFKTRAIEGLGCVGGYAADKADAINAINTYAEMETFKAENEVITFDGNKFYRIQNVYRKTFIDIDNNNRALREKDNADIDQLWQVEAGTDGAYFIKSPNAGYMQAVGNNELVAETGAQFVISSFYEGAGQFAIKSGNDMLAGINSTTLGTWWNGSIDGDMSYRFIEAVDVEITLSNINEEGWATAYLPFDVTLSEGLTAYYVNEIHTGYVTFAETTDVPANNGVILRGEPGKYTLNIAKASSTITGNYLSGTTVTKEITKEDGNAYYVLAKPAEAGLGFYNAVLGEDVTKFKNVANKAYLMVPAEQAQGVKSYSFRFGEGTTGVENVEVESASNVIYDLTGRRVEVAERGIYIINGKKVLVK